MADFELDPDGLHATAGDVEGELAGLDTPRQSLSTTTDEAVGSVESDQIAGQLLNVWNHTFAPVLEGTEQRVNNLGTGLRNVANEYGNGDQRMARSAVAGLDDAPSIEITDAKEI